MFTTNNLPVSTAEVNLPGGNENSRLTLEISGAEILQANTIIFERLLQFGTQIPEFLPYIHELLAAIKDMKIRKAEKLWKQHPDVLNFFKWDNMSALFTEAHTKIFLRKALSKRIHPLIDCLFEPEKYISGNDDEKAKAIKDVLSICYAKAIRKIAAWSISVDGNQSQALLTWYINRCTEDTDKANAIKDVLSCRCPEAIQPLISLSIQVEGISQNCILWYLNTAVDERTKINRIEYVANSYINKKDKLNILRLVLLENPNLFAKIKLNQKWNHLAVDLKALLNYPKTDLSFLPDPGRVPEHQLFILTEKQGEALMKDKEVPVVHYSKVRNLPFYKVEFDKNKYVDWYKEKGANHGLGPILPVQTHSQANVVSAICASNEEQQAIIFDSMQADLPVMNTVPNDKQTMLSSFWSPEVSGSLPLFPSSLPLPTAAIDNTHKHEKNRPEERNPKKVKSSHSLN